MDKDGGNWTQQDIEEWDKRLDDAPKPRTESLLRRFGHRIMEWLDCQGDMIAKNGLSPYNYPHDYRSNLNLFAHDDTDDDERHTL